MADGPGEGIGGKSVHSTAVVASAIGPCWRARCVPRAAAMRAGRAYANGCARAAPAVTRSCAGGCPPVRGGMRDRIIMPRCAQPRVFLLSPAHLGGERARILMRPEASFDLAARVREKRRCARRRDLRVSERALLPRQAHLRGRVRGGAASPRSRRPTSSPPTAGWPPCTSASITRARPRWAASTSTARRGLSQAARARRQEAGEADRRRRGGAARLGGVDEVHRRARARCSSARLVCPVDFVGRGDMSRGSLMLQARRAPASSCRTPPCATSLVIS